MSMTAPLVGNACIFKQHVVHCIQMCFSKVLNVQLLFESFTSVSHKYTSSACLRVITQGFFCLNSGGTLVHLFILENGILHYTRHQVYTPEKRLNCVLTHTITRQSPDRPCQWNTHSPTGTANVWKLILESLDPKKKKKKASLIHNPNSSNVTFQAMWLSAHINHSLGDIYILRRGTDIRLDNAHVVWAL